jgi:hypothetical protein
MVTAQGERRIVSFADIPATTPSGLGTSVSCEFLAFIAVVVPNSRSAAASRRRQPPLGPHWPGGGQIGCSRPADSRNLSEHSASVVVGPCQLGSGMAGPGSRNSRPAPGTRSTLAAVAKRLQLDQRLERPRHGFHVVCVSRPNLHRWVIGREWAISRASVRGRALVAAGAEKPAGPESRSRLFWF